MEFMSINSRQSRNLSFSTVCGVEGASVMSVGKQDGGDGRLVGFHNWNPVYP